MLKITLGFMFDNFFCYVVIIFSLGFSEPHAGIQDYSLMQYTSSDGLPQNSVKAIVEDKNGLLWIGTENGLARYDGHRFKYIESPFESMIVQSLFVDESNNVLVEWENNSITVYDTSTKKWKSLYMNDRPLDSNFGLLLKSGKKVVLNKNGFTKELFYIDKSLNVEKLNNTLNHYLKSNIVAIKDFVMINDILWVGGTNKFINANLSEGIYTQVKLEYSNEIIYSFINIDQKYYVCTNLGIYEINEKPKLKPLVKYSINNIVKGENQFCIKHQSKIVYSIDSNGINTYDIRTNKILSYANNDINAIELNNYFQNIYSNGKKLWVINENNLIELDENNNLTVLKIPNRYNFRQINLSPIIQTQDGSVWVGTEKSGLFHLSQFKNKFKTIHSPISGKHLYRKAISVDNTIWLGSNEGGVSVINRDNNEWKHYNHNEVARNPVRAIVKDSENNIWVGNAGGDLLKYNATIDDFEIVFKGSLLESGINVLLILDDNIWFMTGGTLKKYNIADNSTRTIPVYLNGNNLYVKALISDNNSNIILGTQNEGVIIVDQEGIVLNQWKTQLKSKSIFSLFQDKFDNLWVGTWGGGMYRINLKTDQIQSLNKENNFLEKTVYGIVPEGEGILWMSGNTGLTKIEGCISQKWPCEPKIETYNNKDGLQADEFDSEAYALLDTNEIYFAGSNGINIFKPDEIKLNSNSQEIIFTDIYIDSVNYTGNPSLINLKYDFKGLILQFSLLDFHDSTSNQYEYKYAYSDDWQQLDMPKMDIHNLKYGNYNLKIRARNNDGIRSKNTLSIDINIESPVYLKWFAFVIYFIVVLSIIILIIKLRENILVKQNKYLEKNIKKRTRQLKKEQEALKNNIYIQNKLYASISHEIKTPLTLLLAPIEELKQNKGDFKKHLETIERQSQELKYFINNLVNLTTLKTKKNIVYGSHEVVPYLCSLKNDFSYLAKQKNIELSLDIILDPSAAVRSYRRSLNIIMNNLLENSIKQVPVNGKIIIKAFQAKTELTILVEDNGPGIPENDLNSIFEFGTTNNVKHNWLNSLGIGLSISQETAISLGGKLFVDNCELGGACFGLTLPLATKDLLSINDDTNIIKTNYDYDQESYSVKNNELKPCLLVIDDNTSILATLRQQLNHSYNVFTATTAEEGKKFINTFIPEIVICDVMLPTQTGFDLLNEIKTDIKTDDVIMIMLTAMDEESAKLKSMEFHADAFLSKPYSKHELILTIQHLLFIREKNKQNALLEQMSKSINEVEIQSETKKIYPKLLGILDKNYSNNNFKSNQIAKAMNMSLSSLHRKLKEETYQSLGQIIYSYRINKAKTMLENDVSIIKTSYDCGFSSPSHFSIKFKKMTSTTPREYLKTHLKNP